MPHSRPPDPLTVFRSDPWFSTLRESDAQRLLAAARPRRLARGQPLYWKGEPLPADGASFYGLVEGSIKASAVTMTGKETILRFLEPGNWFGELSAIDDLPRDYGITALTDAHLLEVPCASFRTMLAETSFSNAVLRLMGSRLRTFYSTIENVTTSGPLTRVAHRLFTAANGGVRPAQQPHTVIRLNQESLCLMSGLSRPTVIRALKTLEESGTISQQYGKIVVMDMQALQEQAFAVAD